MTELTRTADINRGYWPKGLAGQLATGLCGIIAVLVALKAAAYEPATDPAIPHQDHFFRILAFAALTIWATFAVGVRRRGAAAIITLTFALFVEMVLVPIRHEGMSTLVSANLGIVLAYCAMHLYWLDLVKRRLKH